MKPWILLRSCVRGVSCLLLFAAVPARAINLDLSVLSPGPPTVITPTDEVELFATSVVDVFPNGSHTLTSEAVVNGNAIDWSIISVNNDLPSFQVLLPMTERVTLGPFAPGTYQVNADWRHESFFGTLGPSAGEGATAFRVYADNGMPGDYDHNGQVAQGDLDLVLQNWGAPSHAAPNTWLNHAPTGLIDQHELDGVLQNWGTLAAPDFGGFASVPEPGTVVLFSGLLLLGAARRL